MSILIIMVSSMTYFAALLRYPSSRLPSVILTADGELPNERLHLCPSIVATQFYKLLWSRRQIVQYCDTCGLEEPFQLVSYDNLIPSPCISLTSVPSVTNVYYFSMDCRDAYRFVRCGFVYVNVCYGAAFMYAAAQLCGRAYVVPRTRAAALS